MRKLGQLLTILLVLGAVVSCASRPRELTWLDYVGAEVQAMGYGNWIVIADASYPYQEVEGFRTIIATEEIPEVLDHVLKEMEKFQHTRPSFFVPRELRYISNDQAPGIDFYRGELTEALHGYTPRELELSILENIVSESAKKYSVLVIKTTTTLPYSTVFLDLDSGYWDRAAEQELRARILASNFQIQ